MADTKIEEMRNYLREALECRVSMEDFKNPTTEVTVKVYCAFLDALGISTDNFNQMPFQIMPDSEHYQDLTPIINLTRVLNLILKHIGFSIKLYLDDLLNPKPKKSKVIFMHLYQYNLFWQDKIKIYNPFVEDFQIKLSQEEEMSNDIENMISEINTFQAEIQVLNPSHLAERLQATELLVSGATKRKEKYVLERQQLKNELNSVIYHHDVLIKEKDNSPDAIEAMEKKILPNLEKLQEQLIMLDRELDVLNSRCEELREKPAQFDVQLKTGESAIQNIDRLISVDKEVFLQASAMCEKIKKLSDNVKLIECKKSETMIFEKRATQQNETLKTLKQQNEKQLRRLQRQIETKDSELESAHVHSKGVSVVDSTTLEKKKRKLIQLIEDDDKKEQSSQDEFRSMCEQLDDLVVQDAENWASIVKTVTQNLLDIDEELIIKCELKSLSPLT